MPMAAPFGTKVSIEVQFPRVRFFNLQVTPSFLPGAYHNGYWYRRHTESRKSLC